MFSFVPKFLSFTASLVTSFYHISNLHHTYKFSIKSIFPNISIKIFFTQSPTGKGNLSSLEKRKDEWNQMLRVEEKDDEDDKHENFFPYRNLFAIKYSV